MGKVQKCKNKAPWLTQIDTCLSYKCVTCVTIGVAGEINELGGQYVIKFTFGSTFGEEPDFSTKLLDATFTKRSLG